jgi:hypothetical protein
MSDTASAAAAVARHSVYDESPTGRQPALAVVSPAWDDVPSGRVPESVIRYFEEANAREEERRRARSARVYD